MIKFNAQSDDELKEELAERSEEIAHEIVRGICDALDEDADSVIIGVFEHLDFQLIAKRDGFLEALKENLYRIEELEDFELCNRTKIWIEKLETE